MPSSTSANRYSTVNKQNQLSGRKAPQAAENRVGPLSSIKVLDLTHMLAGPYCTWVLGALGADVIKVEVPGKGDFTRSIAPFCDEKSVYFSSVNRNKRSVTLNLKQPSGRQAFLKLAERADVLVENNRPGVMKRLKLDYASISEINPSIVYASISGFGQTGPYSERPAFDAVIQAMSGIMSITGAEKGPPARVGTSIGDIGASLFGTIGILAALTDRAVTRRGAYVDVAMFDAQVAILENAVARYINVGDVPRRLGSRHPLIAPFQAFATKDEPIVVCVDTEAQWERYCATIGRADLVKNPLFASGSLRAENHGHLEPALSAAMQTRTRAEWLSLLEAADVPNGPINDVPTVVNDPQIRARGMVVPQGKGGYVNQPIRFSGYPNMRSKQAPQLGADTEAVLREYGFSTEDISKMKTENAI
jgi:CoA:oxalate CoA-transferase